MWASGAFVVVFAVVVSAVVQYNERDLHAGKVEEVRENDPTSSLCHFDNSDDVLTDAKRLIITSWLDVVRVCMRRNGAITIKPSRDHAIIHSMH